MNKKLSLKEETWHNAGSHNSAADKMPWLHVGKDIFSCAFMDRRHPWCSSWKRKNRSRPRSTQILTMSWLNKLQLCSIRICYMPYRTLSGFSCKYTSSRRQSLSWQDSPIPRVFVVLNHIKIVLHLIDSPRFAFHEDQGPMTRTYFMTSCSQLQIAREPINITTKLAKVLFILGIA